MLILSRKPELTFTGLLIFPKNNYYIIWPLAKGRQHKLSKLTATIATFPWRTPLSKIPGHHPKFQTPSQWGNSKVNRSHSQSNWGASTMTREIRRCLDSFLQGCLGASWGQEQEVGWKIWITATHRWTCECYWGSDRGHPEGAQDAGHMASFSSSSTKL